MAFKTIAGEFPDQETALQELRDSKYRKVLYEENLRLTKKDIKGSVKDDLLIIQSIRSLQDIDKAVNMLSKRIREWYEYYNPEVSRSIPDHDTFIEAILRGQAKQEESMGADLATEDIESILSLAKKARSLYEEKQFQEDYIKKKMEKICPNMLAITGALIGAKLLDHSGSLKHLSELPASTIQLLGAEAALFRHITTGAKCPKYGVLINHPLVQEQKPKMKGKAARALADKISIATKIDHFKGEFIGDKLYEQVTKRFK